MKRIPFLAIVLLAFAFPAHARDAMKNDATKKDAMKKDAAVKPADPELKVVLDSWNEIGRKLTAMAEDFPEDIRLQAHAGRTQLRRAVAACGRIELFLHQSRHGEGASGSRRSQARPIQVQGRDCCVRQESLRRWRSRHPVERRKRHDDGGCLLPWPESACSRHSIRPHRA